MEKKVKVLPECISASNPYHECVDYCYRKIAEAKALVAEKLDEDQNGVKHAREREVHPECINASNPYHECRTAGEEQGGMLERVQSASTVPSKHRREKGGESTLKRKNVASPTPGDDDLRISIPEETLAHLSTCYQKADVNLSHLGKIIRTWNSEFVKIKYISGEYKRKLISKYKELADLGDRLTGCRTELSTMVTSLSLQRQEVDHSQEESVEARAEVTRLSNDLKTSKSEVTLLKAELQTLRNLVSQREASLDGSAVVDAFKESYAFKSIIQDHVEEARAHIFDVEVKNIEGQCFEEGFFRGFHKGIRLVHRQTGAEIADLTISQVSEDPIPVDIEDDAESAIRVDDEEDTI